VKSSKSNRPTTPNQKKHRHIP